MQHPVRISRNRRRTPFFKCQNFGPGTTVFLEGPIGSQVIENGGARPGRVNPGAGVEREDADIVDVVDGQDQGSVPVPDYRCPSCNSPIVVGQEVCVNPDCREELVWAEDDVDMDDEELAGRIRKTKRELDGLRKV